MKYSRDDLVRFIDLISERSGRARTFTSAGPDYRRGKVIIAVSSDKEAPWADLTEGIPADAVEVQVREGRWFGADRAPAD